MSEEKKTEEYYQIRAKEVVDVLFDKKFFREDVNRDDMQAVEDFVAYNFQSHAELAVKCAMIMKGAKERN